MTTAQSSAAAQRAVQSGTETTTPTTPTPRQIEAAKAQGEAAQAELRAAEARQAAEKAANVPEASEATAAGPPGGPPGPRGGIDQGPALIPAAGGAGTIGGGGLFRVGADTSASEFQRTLAEIVSRWGTHEAQLSEEERENKADVALGLLEASDQMQLAGRADLSDMLFDAAQEVVQSCSACAWSPPNAHTEELILEAAVHQVAQFRREGGALLEAGAREQGAWDQAVGHLVDGALQFLGFRPGNFGEQFDPVQVGEAIAGMLEEYANVRGADAQVSDVLKGLAQRAREVGAAEAQRRGGQVSPEEARMLERRAQALASGKLADLLAYVAEFGQMNDAELLLAIHAAAAEQGGATVGDTEIDILINALQGHYGMNGLLLGRVGLVNTLLNLLGLYNTGRLNLQQARRITDALKEFYGLDGA